MKSIYRFLGLTFPINLKFSLWVIPLSLLLYPIIIFGIIFFGLSLVLVPFLVVGLFLGVANLIAYLVSRKTLLENKTFTDIDTIEDFDSDYSSLFKEPFVKNSYLEVNPYFVEQKDGKGYFVLKEGELGEVANYSKILNSAKERFEDESEETSRKDTLWGDFKLISKVGWREASHRGKILKDESSKDQINIIVDGDFSNLDSGKRHQLFLSQGPNGIESFSFTSAQGTTNGHSDKSNISELNNVKSHVERRGRIIFFATTFLLIFTYVNFKNNETRITTNKNSDIALNKNGQSDVSQLNREAEALKLGLPILLEDLKKYIESNQNIASIVKNVETKTSSSLYKGKTYHEVFINLYMRSNYRKDNKQQVESALLNVREKWSKTIEHKYRLVTNISFYDDAGLVATSVIAEDVDKEEIVFSK